MQVEFAQSDHKDECSIIIYSYDCVAESSLGGRVAFRGHGMDARAMWKRKKWIGNI